MVDSATTKTVLWNKKAPFNVRLINESLAKFYEAFYNNNYAISLYIKSNVSLTFSMNQTTSVYQIKYTYGDGQFTGVCVSGTHMDG